MAGSPPLPICAEGGGGTQLRGSRDHSLAQGLGHIPPGRASSLAPTLSPDAQGEKRGRREGVKRGRRKRRSGGNSIGGVKGQPCLPQSHQALRDPSGEELSPAHHRCHPPPDPQGQSGAHTLIHLQDSPHPTPSSTKNPPTRNVITACLSDTHQPLTSAQGTTPFPTVTWCQGACAFASPTSPGPPTTGHTEAHTCYTLTETQGHTLPITVHIPHPYPYCNLTPTPYRPTHNTAALTRTHSLALHPSHGAPSPSPDCRAHMSHSRYGEHPLTSTHPQASYIHPNTHIDPLTAYHPDTPHWAPHPCRSSLGLRRGHSEGPNQQDGPWVLTSGRGRRGTQRPPPFLSPLPSASCHHHHHPPPHLVPATAAALQAPPGHLMNGWAGPGA